ncbi:MAG: zinc-ribbon and DUF3426 domain-containing protein [Usitatibacter sp.]
MLITTCSHCLARFRVSPQQLNAKQGQVRCGRCSKVFNGFVALERFPDDDTGGRLLAAQETNVPPPPTPPVESVDLEPVVEGEMPEIETLDTDEIPAAVTAAAPPELPSYPPRLRAAPQPAPLVLEEPPPKPPPSRAWAFGVVLLAFVLALELTYAYRGTIAQRYPAVRPTLESACAQLQCTVPWSREESLLKLEDSELLEVPGKPSEIALGARIRNLASVAQDYPHLELTLTDISGQAAMRRVLRPTDYLGRPLVQGEVLPPGVEVALQLRLETPRVKATGYELLLFYP